MKYRENRTHRGYMQLVRYLPSAKAKLVDLDVPELNQYFREVCLYFFLHQSLGLLKYYTVA
jgi:hypothetical protein